MQVQARAGRIEEDEVAESEDVRQAQDLAVEALGSVDIADRKRHLADGAQARSVGAGHDASGPPSGVSTVWAICGAKADSRALCPLQRTRRRTSAAGAAQFRLISVPWS